MCTASAFASFSYKESKAYKVLHGDRNMFKAEVPQSQIVAWRTSSAPDHISTQGTWLPELTSVFRVTSSGPDTCNMLKDRIASAVAGHSIYEVQCQPADLVDPVFLKQFSEQNSVHLSVISVPDESNSACHIVVAPDNKMHMFVDEDTYEQLGLPHVRAKGHAHRKAASKHHICIPMPFRLEGTSKELKRIQTALSRISCGTFLLCAAVSGGEQLRPLTVQFPTSMHVKHHSYDDILENVMIRQLGNGFPIPTICDTAWETPLKGETSATLVADCLDWFGLCRLGLDEMLRAMPVSDRDSYASSWNVSSLDCKASAANLIAVHIRNTWLSPVVIASLLRAFLSDAQYLGSCSNETLSRGQSALLMPESPWAVVRQPSSSRALVMRCAGAGTDVL